MEKALLTAGILFVPTFLLVIGFRLTGRKVQWTPLLWAGFACLVYFLLLRSRDVIPNPAFMDGLVLNWFGKTLSIAGTVAMLYFLPRVDLRAAGLTWQQNKESLGVVVRMGALVLLLTAGGAFLVSTTPNTSVENLLWQASMPGIDEELFSVGCCYSCSTRRSARD